MPEEIGYDILIRCREEYVNMLKNIPHSNDAINENARLCRSRPIMIWVIMLQFLFI